MTDETTFHPAQTSESGPIRTYLQEVSIQELEDLHEREQVKRLASLTESLASAREEKVIRPKVRDKSAPKLASAISGVLFGKFDREKFERMLLLEEADMGADIFGDRRPGYRRDFFLLNESTWVWNEQIDTEDGPHIVTTRYVIGPESIYKTQDGGPHTKLVGDELDNLVLSAQMYDHKVRELYDKL